MVELLLLSVEEKEKEKVKSLCSRLICFLLFRRMAFEFLGICTESEEEEE